jgi:hypothetical protein
MRTRSPIEVTTSTWQARGLGSPNRQVLRDSTPAVARVMRDSLVEIDAQSGVRIQRAGNDPPSVDRRSDGVTSNEVPLHSVSRNGRAGSSGSPTTAMPSGPPCMPATMISVS